MITVSTLIVDSALRRKGSVGAHYRSDYKLRGEDEKQHIILDKYSFQFEPEKVKTVLQNEC